ncbi:unnamed protein product [Lactuca saligna]|uniref:FAD dependent oxidoreductase domain-containing protein n=1 Tax=Lactuca saligna TaxID=75948 RepID=A0AA35YMU3_LACSI|nr:unnamed protein product [Lactuca saligna]
MKSPFSVSYRLVSIITTVRASMDDPQKLDPTKKRVVVCGGGVIGVCTAYFLSKKGAAVTLIEQSSIACAASGKAGGFLALDWCDGSPISSLARVSFNLHRSLAEELNGGESYGYRPLNTLSLSIAESENPPQPHSRKSTLPPWIDGPAKSPKTIGTTETTAQVHPQLFTRTLIEKAVADYGVEVVIGKVKSLETGEEKVRVVMEGGGGIDGDAVVLALGPWTKADAITPDALFLTYSPANGGQPMDPEIYPRPTGEVYVCGMSSEEEIPDDPEEIQPNMDSIGVLKRVAEKVSSHLGGEARVKAEQACFLPSTDDGVPVIGEVPGMKGCFVATGHSCWGILNGPATGAAVAELVLDGCSTVVDLTRFSPGRFVGGRGRRR